MNKQKRRYYREIIPSKYDGLSTRELEKLVRQKTKIRNIRNASREDLISILKK